MTNNKKTIKTMLTQILNNHKDVLTDEEVEFLEGRIEQAEKKSSGGKKATATQIANEGIKAEILNSMEKGKKYTITDMLKGFTCCAELSNQKVSALANQLEKNKALVKTQENRKSYFELA